MITRLLVQSFWTRSGHNPTPARLMQRNLLIPFNYRLATISQDFQSTFKQRAAGKV